MTYIKAHDVEVAIKGDYIIEVYYNCDGKWKYTGSYSWSFDNGYHSDDADWYELEQEVRYSNLVRLEKFGFTNIYKFYLD